MQWQKLIWKAGKSQPRNEENFSTGNGLCTISTFESVPHLLPQFSYAKLKLLLESGQLQKLKKMMSNIKQK